MLKASVLLSSLLASALGSEAGSGDVDWHDLCQDNPDFVDSEPRRPGSW